MSTNNGQVAAAISIYREAGSCFLDDGPQIKPPITTGSQTDSQPRSRHPISNRARRKRQTTAKRYCRAKKRARPWPNGAASLPPLNPIRALQLPGLDSENERSKALELNHELIVARAPPTARHVPCGTVPQGRHDSTTGRVSSNLQSDWLSTAR